MAIATMNTILKYKVSDAFEKLVDIKDYPDLGSAPELLETTTLTQTERHTNIKGLQDATDLTFTANYTLLDYTKVKGLEGEEHEFQLELGAEGVDGTFGWKVFSDSIPNMVDLNVYRYKMAYVGKLDKN
ncbi:MAG TPA: hypothetical protein VFC79_13095, partial [Tissierellaceae bacterium]|nr:hypothetical protein [Tissierellaceae bacterium]